MREFYNSYKESKSFLEECKKTIANNKQNKETIQRKLEEMYRHLRAFAPLFYDKQCNYFDSYYDMLIDILVFTEKMFVPENLFTIPSEPTFTYKKRVINKPRTNNVEKILDWLVYKARQNYANLSVLYKDTMVQYSSFEGECNYMSTMINTICEDYNIPCKIVRINPGFEKDAHLYKDCKFHDICIITLNGEDYIIDCTYRQFFMIKNCSLERIGVPFISGTTAGAFMTLNSDRLDLAQILLKRGWIKLTPENIKNYFDGFALSFRNGHYYDETKDYSYTTLYTSQNYLDFIEGTDSQLKHESQLVLSFQTTISHYNPPATNR